jgi:hypothetical protein
MLNGTQAQLTGFRNETGATFPLLLNAATGPGDENLTIPYSGRDNYAVINQQGIVRYHAREHWPYSNGYHLDEILGTVDSLVSAPVRVGDDLSARGFGLSAAPNPFRRVTAIELVNPSDRTLDARVAVYDLAGREVAMCWSGPVPRGVKRIAWDGNGESGRRLAPGVYLVCARLGSVDLMRRVVRMP